MPGALLIARKKGMMPGKQGRRFGKSSRRILWINLGLILFWTAYG